MRFNCLNYCDIVEIFFIFRQGDSMPSAEGMEHRVKVLQWSLKKRRGTDQSLVAKGLLVFVMGIVATILLFS